MIIVIFIQRNGTTNYIMIVEPCAMKKLMGYVVMDDLLRLEL